MIDSRASDGGLVVRRRRECVECSRRYTTYERVEKTARLMVVKKDGSRVPFDPENVLKGLQAACGKRPVAEEDKLRVAQETEEEIHREFEKQTAERYLRPGFAFGGSCLPKDLRATLSVARERSVPVPMLGGVLESNRVQVERLLERIVTPARPSVAIIGLSFKEDTDDVRESPMVTLVEQLCGKGHPVRIYDETLSVGTLIGANRSYALSSIPHLSDLLG